MKAATSISASLYEPTLLAMPPPRSAHAPVNAGRQPSVRKNIAPFSWCSAPMIVRIPAGRVVA